MHFKVIIELLECCVVWISVWMNDDDDYIFKFIIGDQLHRLIIIRTMNYYYPWGGPSLNPIFKVPLWDYQFESESFRPPKSI